MKWPFLMLKESNKPFLKGDLGINNFQTQTLAFDPSVLDTRGKVP